MRTLDDTNIYIKDRTLFPFGPCVYLTNDDVFLYGRFNFATMNKRKTLDKIPKSACTALIPSKKYHNAKPVVTSDFHVFHYELFFIEHIPNNLFTTK